LSLTCLASEFNVAFVGRQVLVDRERKPVIGAVGAGLLDHLACCGGPIFSNGPFPLAALASSRKRKSRRGRSGRHTINGNHGGSCLCGREQRRVREETRGEKSGQN